MVKDSPAETTRVAEDYVTLIWKACEWPDDGRRPTTTELAASLGVTLSTVSANLKRLAREGLIRYEPYGAIELTEQGEQIALQMVRRHRLIETFLVQQLGYPWDQVHDEADRLEHAVSDTLMDRIDALLGYPEIDPHGDPIPRQGSAPAISATLLSGCAPGELVQIVRISDEEPDILKFLADQRIALGTPLQVETPMAATGLMTVRHGTNTIQLSAPIAAAIHVTAPRD